jgi:hypothetical protein
LGREKSDTSKDKTGDEKPMRYKIIATGKGYPPMNMEAEQEKVILGIVQSFLKAGYSKIALDEVE